MMQDASLFRALMHEDFASFARRALAEIMPGVDLKWNWHLDLIADRLTRLANGEIKRLLICVPPRSLKSLLCSVLFPAWLLGREATERILCLSYAQPLAEDFARQCRQLIAYNPKDDKLIRFGGITPMIEGGHVHLPHAASWLDDYLHELCGFPSTKYDDQVDSTSQALHWIRAQGTNDSLLEFYRLQDEKRRAYAEDRIVQLRAPHGFSHVSTRDGTSLDVGPDRTVWVSEADVGALLLAGFTRLN